MSDTNAAENLSGTTLQSGWEVRERLEKGPGATGGFFSVGYRVSKAGEEGFLKAFNFAAFLNLSRQQPGQPRLVMDVMGDMIAAWRYERDLSALCKAKHVTKVAFVRDAGEHIVPGHTIGVVPYLIFDVADGGDIRSRMSFASRLETPWKLKSLHSVAVGLKQLHFIDVSHQDLKPSNILIFKEESKIGDLGRSICLTLPSPFADDRFAGDFSYAPPEMLYDTNEPNWRKRSFACDAYLFGSLVVFYFSGLTMTALIRTHLDNAVSWERFRGTYDEALPYVLNAFAAALRAFEDAISDDFIRGHLRQIVEHLCHPVPLKRCLGPNGNAGTALAMERVITRLDSLATRSALNMKRLPNG